MLPCPPGCPHLPAPNLEAPSWEVGAGAGSPTEELMWGELSRCRKCTWGWRRPSLPGLATPGLQEATDLIPCRCSWDWVISGFQVLQ